MAKTKAKSEEVGNLRPRSLSPTCLDTYNQCLLKFWFRYHTKEEDLGETVALRFGSAVHAALEYMNKRLLFGELLSPELCEDAAQEFIKCAAAQRIDDPDLLKEGQDLVRARLYRHNPNYPVKSTELNFYQLQMTTDKGVPLNGIIDLVQEMSPSTALIIDYKTSRKAKTLQEARKDVQLSMYDYMFSKSHPHYQQIWLALDFLRSEPVLTERTLDERMAFEKWLNAVWEAMGDQSPKDVRPTINQYCPWCGYKHKCSAYKAVMEAKVEFKPIATLTSQSEFTDEWTRAKALEKIAKNRVDELKGWANNRVDLDNMYKFENTDSVVTWTAQHRTSYDPARVIPFIPIEDLPRLVSIKNEAIENYIGIERPDLRAAISGAAMTNASSRITTRKK
jgi:RecB family exonuclease